MFNVPIVVVIFNRPQCAKQLMDALNSLQPTNIYVVSDAPRDDVAGEKAKVLASRSFFENIPWPCQVQYDYASRNMGTMDRISSGLDWVFSNVRQAIILEDDCIPNLEFFQFCEVLLERYAEDERVLSISGTRLAPEQSSPIDYQFSRYAFCWGWATWARAWSKFDCDMLSYAKTRKTKFLRSHFGGFRQAIYWRWLLDRVVDGRIGSWAYKWTFAHWFNNGLAIVPRVNLVSNEGFGEDATNTKTKSRWLSMDVKMLSFPLREPLKVVPDSEADQWIEDHVFSKSVRSRISWAITWCKTRVNSLRGV